MLLPCRQLGYNTVPYHFGTVICNYPQPKDYSVSCWSMSQGEGKQDASRQTEYSRAPCIKLVDCHVLLKLLLLLPPPTGLPPETIIEALELH